MTTGMALPRSAAGQRSYLERLDDAGMACLAVSERMFVPPLTAAFLAAAAARGFPVVEVPIPVPFMAISQEVAAAVVLGGAGQRLNAQLQVFGAVQWLAAGNVSAAEIFARLERLSGYSLYACTLGRKTLLEGLPVPPPEYADLIPATVTSPPTVPGGYVLPVTGPRGTAGYILAMESPSAAPAGVSVVQHIATVAALQLSMLAHEREMLRRSGAETLAESWSTTQSIRAIWCFRSGSGWSTTGRPTGRRGRCTSTRTPCCTGSAGSSSSAGGRWPRPKRWPRCGWPCAPRPPCRRVSVGGYELRT
jgi:PucR family transcriptional regulator, purine catabolism regulatory protein